MAGALVVLAAGCSDDGDASPSPIGSTSTIEPPAEATTTPDTTIESTLAPATTTTQPVTTTEPTTAVPEPTVSPTSDVPTTTTLPDGVPPRVTFPDDPDKQAVVDAAYAYFDSLRAASMEPASVEMRAALRATVTEPLASRVVGFLDELVSEGQRVVGSSRTPTYLEVWDFTVTLYEGGATFDACVVDSDVLVEVNPDGTDTTLNDRVVSAAQTYHFTDANGGWSVSDVQRFGRFEDQVGCG